MSRFLFLHLLIDSHPLQMHWQNWSIDESHRMAMWFIRRFFFSRENSFFRSWSWTSEVQKTGECREAFGYYPMHRPIQRRMHTMHVIQLKRLLILSRCFSYSLNMHTTIATTYSADSSMQSRSSSRYKVELYKVWFLKLNPKVFPTKTRLYETPDEHVTFYLMIHPFIREKTSRFWIEAAVKP